MDKKKMSKKKKRILVAVSTVIGVIVLFFTVAFFPVGTYDVSDKNSENGAETNEEKNVSQMKKSDLEQRVRELEEENFELKTEVEKYKILAEQNTKSVVSPAVSSGSSSDSGKKTTEKENGYKSSTEYYDKDYKNYTNEPSTDVNDTPAPDVSEPVTEPSQPTDVPQTPTDLPTSDTGL